jgi:SAM-dependent methyltransferase
VSFLEGYPGDLTGWVRDERIAKQGFSHPWQSRVAAANGEIFFDELVRGHLSADMTVADVGCGHGDYTMRLAASAAHVIGVDQDPAAISLARTLASERQISNVDFIESPLNANASSSAPHAVSGRSSVDLFVSRRGPTLSKWLHWALSVSRPGVFAIGIHPTGRAGAVPSWNDELPDHLRIRKNEIFTYEQVLQWVTSALAETPARLHSSWWLDVPEVVDSADELHARLTGDRAAQEPDLLRLQSLIDHQGGSVELRHCRLVWKVSLP